MVDEASVSSIISQYERFGWQLHHVLLSPEVKASIETSISSLFNGKEVRLSDLNAIWFSRPAPNGRVAWELRAIGDFPFALVDSAEPNDPASELEAVFVRTEMKMRERLRQNPRTH
jgi:hypothetical protein